MQKAFGISRKPLGKEEEAELLARIRTGDVLAKRTFVEANLRLVDHFGKRYSGFSDYGDLLQYGYIGLLIALDRFDPLKGRFSTIAAFWIRRAFEEGVGRMRPCVTIPPHVVVELRQFKGIVESLTQILHRPPQISEIASESGFSEKKVRALFDLLKDPVSAGTPFSNEEDFENRKQEIRDEKPLPTETLDAKSLRQSLDVALGSLSERESIILSFRYGLGENEETKTYGQIGKMLALSDERVRQLEKDILVKLEKRAMEG